MFKDIAKLVGKIAPVVGRAIANPVGTVAELGLGIVKKTLGLDPGAPESEIKSRLEALSPADVLALQEMELQYAVQFAQLEVQDKGDARDLAREKGLVHHAVITYTFILGYFGLMISVGFGLADAEAIGGAWRVLDAAFGVILTFWFGSSFGSKVKDTIAKEKARNGG